jgi:hypothetical protein
MEPVDMFCSEYHSLSHLVSMTLLKLRLRLDLMPYEDDDFDFLGPSTFSELDRPVGALIRGKIRNEDIQDVSATVQDLEGQYRRLSHVVQEANSHF